MFNPYLLESEITWHHDKLQMDYAASQLPVTFQGIRAVVGQSFIRVGTLIQGKAREACEECAETGRALANSRTVSLSH